MQRWKREKDESEEVSQLRGACKKHKSSVSRSSLNGSFVGARGARIVSEDDGLADPNDQLQNEMRQAARGEEDVKMTG